MHGPARSAGSAAGTLGRMPRITLLSSHLIGDQTGDQTGHQTGDQTFDAAPGQTVLAAALAAGIAMTSSCRNGTCRACRRLLISGAAEHTIEWPGLSREEKADGWVLPCVLRPLGDCVLGELGG